MCARKRLFQLLQLKAGEGRAIATLFAPRRVLRRVVIGRRRRVAGARLSAIRPSRCRRRSRINGRSDGRGRIAAVKKRGVSMSQNFRRSLLVVNADFLFVVIDVVNVAFYN